MSSNKNYHDEEWLRARYVAEQQKISSVADEAGCSNATICRWLKKHDIQTRDAEPSTPEKLQDAEWMHKQYVVYQRSSTDIANEVGYSTSGVLGWLDRHGIERRGRFRSTPDELQDSSWLEEQYTNLRKTRAEIASELGCCINTVSRWLDRHGITTQQGGLSPEELTDEEWLRKKYLREGCSTRDISDAIGCSQNAVLRWLNRHGIETREEAPSGEDNRNWNGGSAVYGRGWNKRKRQAVRTRDGHVCQDPRCSVTQDGHIKEHGQKLHVHHLRKARDIDDPEERNAKENLITLCRDCHKRWEKIADAGLVPQLEVEA